jgi:hypothetical protein
MMCLTRKGLAALICHLFISSLYVSFIEATPYGAPAYACNPAILIPHASAAGPADSNQLVVSTIHPDDAPDAPVERITFTPGQPLTIYASAPQPQTVDLEYPYGFMVCCRSMSLCADSFALH